MRARPSEVMMVKATVQATMQATVQGMMASAKAISLAATAALALGAACGSVEGDPDGGPDGGGGTPVTPVAPSAGKAMYQGQQRVFRTTSGGTCNGRVAAGMSGTGFCFLAADDTVKCAGTIGPIVYGSSFAATGVIGAEQILLMFADNGMCVTRTDHTAMCMGTNTTALGVTPAGFTRWTARNDLAALSTGSWEQLCGITTAGQVYCGGGGYGNPPVSVGTAGQTALWVNPAGAAQLSDAMVTRPAEGRTDCQVTVDGLRCGAQIYGPNNGAVVSGTQILVAAGQPAAACWLTAEGSVTCSGSGSRFARGKVLLLAASSVTDSMCAIYNDGSVWCRGSNTAGKLGTGAMTALDVDTMVAPAGSARVKCE
jgi:hypothetical protein